MDPSQASQWIKHKAVSYGFFLCGIAKAQKLKTEANRLQTWLNKGYQGKMKYLENHFDKRIDPTLLVPGSQSVICLAYNYMPHKNLDESNLNISKYALGEDYHHVIKNKLQNMVHEMQEQLGNFHYRVFTDSAPIMERVWAERAGLGWIGKHGLLINKQKGSFFFLCEIICDLKLEYDQAYSQDYCGTCNACVDACPTDAILPNKTLNAQKCISYLTIELKEEIPLEFKNKWDNWIFGCDICQDVCPWNRFSTPHQEPLFNPSPELEQLTQHEWNGLTEVVFKNIFKKSAVKRAGYNKLKGTISFVKK